MKFLPVAERELRVAARRPATHWARLTFTSGFLALAAWTYLTSWRVGVTEMGRSIFYVQVVVLAIYALFVGLRTTADCLSEEKRSGTLGLLFLTDLRGYDVVAGKLLANGLSSFYALVGVLPIVAVPLLMGGVTGAEFTRVAVVLLNTLFFSLAAGMFGSVLCRQARSAVSVTVLMIFGLALLPPALGLAEWWLRDWSGRYAAGFLVPSPVYSLITALETLRRPGNVTGFFWSVGTVHAVAWMFLALSGWLVRHRWQDRPESARGAKIRSMRQEVLEGRTDSRVEFRRRLLDENAFYWHAAQPSSRIYWTWLPLVLAVLGWSWGIYKIGRNWFDPVLYVVTAIALGLVYLAMIGSEAGRRVLMDRKDGAIELLLATSITVREILHGQWLALRRLYLGPVLVYLGWVFLMWWGGASEFSSQARSWWYWIGSGAFVIFVLNIWTLVWSGLWQGVAAKNPRKVFAGTLAPVLFLPFLGTMILTTGYFYLPRMVRQIIDPEYMMWLTWFALSLLVALGIGFYSRHQVRNRFRAVAGLGFEVRRSWWQRLIGRN